MNSRDKLYFWLSLVGMIVIVVISLKIGEAIEFRMSILSDSRTGTPVEYEGTQVEWETFMFDHVLPGQLGPIDYELVTTRTSTLWGALYLLAGLAGGIAGLWLSAAGIRPSGPDVRSRRLPQFASSAVAGVVVYLILRLPAAAISKFFSIAPLREIQSSPHSILDQLLLLAVLAGLFASIFFGQLEENFKRIIRAR